MANAVTMKLTLDFVAPHMPSFCLTSNTSCISVPFHLMHYHPAYLPRTILKKSVVSPSNFFHFKHFHPVAPPNSASFQTQCLCYTQIIHCTMQFYSKNFHPADPPSNAQMTLNATIKHHDSVLTPTLPDLTHFWCDVHRVSQR